LAAAILIMNWTMTVTITVTDGPFAMSRTLQSSACQAAEETRQFNGAVTPCIKV
jgi:hypothetical protein